SLEQANTAVQKLSSLFGGQSTDWLEVDFSDWSNGNEETKLFSALKAAILVKQRVTFQADFVTVTLKISNEMAYRVYDEFSEYEKLTDGDFRVTFSMPQSDWLYQYLATFGEHCEVLVPEDVRRELRDKLQKALEHYK
ncbi:MAG: WYL domain-containing protein, partial [Clostridia bacterium]